MRIGLVFVFVFLAGGVYSQKFPSDFWHEGKIVLEGGDTLKGNVKYSMQNDLLQFEASGRLESFSARKVQFFEIFDQTVKRYRQFYSIPYTTSGEYRAPVFFELLSEGRMTLLCREALEYRTTSSPYYYYGSSTRMVLVNKFFLLKDNGVIEPFVGKKSDFIYLTGNKGELVEKYMKANKLNVDNKNQFAQIVDYYNSLYK
jgi:hypothetical protein